jgi:hypothetical protein
VYVELEAIALSRDIPAAFRLFVTPIVRPVSRDSLATSLHQTKVAIDDSMAHPQAGKTGELNGWIIPRSTNARQMPDR